MKALYQIGLVGILGLLSTTKAAPKMDDRFVMDFPLKNSKYSSMKSVNFVFSLFI